MAYTNYHIQKFTDDSTYEQNISDAANCLTAGAQQFIRCDFSDRVPKEMVLDTSRLVQNRLSAPVAQNLKYLHLEDLDEYTLDIDQEEMFYVGGYLLGDWNSAKMPYVPQAGDNIIADMFGASFLAIAEREDFSLGYAYFRMGQSLISMSVEESLDIENVQGNVRELAVKLNEF